MLTTLKLLEISSLPTSPKKLYKNTKNTQRFDIDGYQSSIVGSTYLQEFEI